VKHSCLACFPAESAQRPSYPSSKPKKDWDKLEAEVKKQVCVCAQLISSFPTAIEVSHDFESVTGEG